MSNSHDKMTTQPNNLNIPMYSSGFIRKRSSFFVVHRIRDSLFLLSKHVFEVSANIRTYNNKNAYNPLFRQEMRCISQHYRKIAS